MIKVALAGERKEVEIVKALLKKYCEEVDIIDEQIKEDIFTSVLTIENKQVKEIEEMLNMLETITGFDPRDNKSFKGKRNVQTRRAASYLLKYRFGFNYTDIAKKLNYASHVSSLIQLRGLKKIKVDRNAIPIELAIRKALVLADRKDGRI